MAQAHRPTARCARPIGSSPHLAMLLTLALGLLLTTLHAPVASAATLISATPDEVHFLTTNGPPKTTTITWDYSNFNFKAFLKLQIDGSNFKLLNKLDNKSGSQDYTDVQLGHTYHFRLDAVENEDSPLPGRSGVIVTTKLDKLEFDLGCSADCIVEASFGPHGTFATANVATNEPAMILIEVSTEPPNPDGSFKGKPIDSSLFTLSKQTALNGNLFKLEPSTKYFYVISATDKGGNVHQEKGSFTTLTRQIKVTWTDIYMDDDSDDFGDAEFDGWISINNDNWLNPSFQIAFADDDFPTGATRHPNMSTTVSKVPGVLHLKVIGSDEDDTGGFGCMFMIQGQEPDYAADEGDCEWARGEKTIDLPTGLAEAVSPQSFTIVANPVAINDSSLKFTINGTFEVSYK